MGTNPAGLESKNTPGSSTRHPCRHGSLGNRRKHLKNAQKCCAAHTPPPPRYPGSRSTCCDIIQAVPRQCSPQLMIITAQSSKAWEAHVYAQPERLSHSSHMLPAASSSTGFNRPPPSRSAFSLCNRLKKSDPTGEGWVVHEWMHHRFGVQGFKETLF